MKRINEVRQSESYMLTLKQRVEWLILHIFWIFPIKKNRIAFICYGCTQYSCNPKYISEYIEENYPGKYEINWYYTENKMASFIPFYAKKAKKNSFMYFYTLMTSKLVVSNVTLPRVVPFRRRQCKVNTWHGTAFKGDNNKFANNYNLFDYFIAENELTYNVFRKKDSFNFKGKIKRIGMPRNDILIRDGGEIRNEVFRELGIPQNKKLVLYAPTFREFDDVGAFNIDFTQLQSSLSNRFGGEWIILFRYHHMQACKHFIPGGVDVGDYPDIQRLMVAADILITDYSSVMWDFSLMYKPVFLYAVDVKRYVDDERGTFFFPFERLPFPISKNNDELNYIITSFDSELYANRVRQYHKEWGRYNYDGNATREFVECFINKIC
ncbi:MAG: CDP-glycerol glycerophosphotransferase family protein [Oscillospiraceae bacterium]|nr:CDP-glycerol glycerophosphotransferase family protein [Oscillospiraceae bacterium]